VWAFWVEAQRFYLTINKSKIMENKKLLKRIWLQIFNDLPPIDVAILKVHLDDYIDDLLDTQTEQDEHRMLDIINRK
tara:strand:+ start:155 stop:385 length:231 start_codon:yes stop_codon:yes gene_type:complete